MKYLSLMLLLISNISFACIVGPLSIEPKPELGFNFKEEQSDQCRNCSMISIDSPKEYDSRPASHAIFSVFKNGELVSKAVTSFEEESKNAEFVGIVSKEKGFSYEVSIEYGTGLCMGYKFVFSGSENGS
ncbi:hypothetical protein [Amphritea atlantica]|nr:hypothetical protein [Amphritea atlantica]